MIPQTKLDNIREFILLFLDDHSTMTIEHAATAVKVAYPGTKWWEICVAFSTMGRVTSIVVDKETPLTQTTFISKYETRAMWEDLHRTTKAIVLGLKNKAYVNPDDVEDPEDACIGINWTIPKLVSAYADKKEAAIASQSEKLRAFLEKANEYVGDDMTFLPAPAETSDDYLKAKAVYMLLLKGWRQAEAEYKDLVETAFANLDEVVAPTSFKIVTTRDNDDFLTQFLPSID